VAAEPEADPALLYSGYPYGVAAAGYPYAGPVAYSSPLAYTHALATPAVAAVAAAPVVTKVEETPAVVSTYNTVAHAYPTVYNTVAHATYNPVVYNAAPVAHAVYSAAPVAHAVYSAAPVVAAVAPSHTITNYNNPEQYTAQSNGVFGPSYIAKNGPVEHIVKREADAEADAAFYYSAGYPYAYNYGAYPAATYAAHHAVAAPVATYAAVHHAAPVATYAAHHAYAAVAPVASLLKTPDHAVAYTAAGLTHSSNVGVCTNVSGVQVPC